MNFPESTPADLTRDERHLQYLALRRARAKLGWFIHASVYVIVNLGLIALALSSGRFWAIYPLLGWGLGLLIHGAAVWLLPPGNALVQRMAAREHARLKARR